MIGKQSAHPIVNLPKKRSYANESATALERRGESFDQAAALASSEVGTEAIVFRICEAIW